MAGNRETTNNKILFSNKKHATDTTTIKHIQKYQNKNNIKIKKNSARLQLFEINILFPEEEMEIINYLKENTPLK